MSPLSRSVHELRPGTQVILNVAGFEERVRTSFVGHERGKFFLMRLPPLAVGGLQGLYDFLYQGNAAKVSFLHDGRIWGFATQVQNYTLKPHALLFTDFPSSIEAHCLRKEDRVECFFPVYAAISGSRLPSMLTDISCGGCQLTIERHESLEGLQVGDTVHLECALFGADGDHCVVCQVRGVQPAGGKCVLGTAFTGVCEPVRGRIEEYVKTVRETMGGGGVAGIS